MRIAIGQIWQETNTFNPNATVRADFESFGITRGEALVEEMSETNELGGFIQSLRRWKQQVDIVGLIRLPAWPSGFVAAATFDWLCDEFMKSVASAGKIDAVLLALHGSMAAENEPDIEGAISIEQPEAQCVDRLGISDQRVDRSQCCGQCTGVDGDRNPRRSVE